VDTWRQTLALDQLEEQHGLPSGLMTSVLRQESGGDPRVRSSAGAQGLFQFMPATARQYGIDPFDPQQAAPAAAQELASLYRKYGGDVDRTLAAWNWGQGNVDRKGMAHMPAETRGFLTNVKRFLRPGVAEAATTAGGRDLSHELFGTTTQPGGRDLSYEVLPAGEAPGRSGAPSPPTARSTPEQDAAYRAWAAQQTPGGTQAPPPAPQPAPAPSQGAPAPAAEPPSDLVIDIEKASPTGPAGPPPTGVGVGSPYDYLPLSARPRLEAPPQEAPLEEQNPAQRWIDTALDVGYGLAGTVVGGATGGIPGMIAGPVIAQGALDRARRHLGMRPQEQAVFEVGPLNVYQSDLLNAGFSLLLGTPDIVTSVLSRTQAGRAIRAADEATRAAHQEWQGAVQEARAAQQAGRREAYQAAERKALDAQSRYQQRVEAREQTIAANQQGYDDALTQYKQEMGQAREQAYRQESGTIAGAQARYQGQVQQQAADVTAQQQAIRSARAVPGRYSPETPAWVLYDKFGDLAKNEVIDLTPAKAGLAEVRAARGVLPDGTSRPFPAQVEQIASTLERAEGSVSVQTIRNELRRLGSLTRSPNGDIRGPAKQLYGLYADALEASPAANDLLRQANATFRREMALEDISDWLRPGRGIVRIDQQGRETINVGALLTRLEKHLGDDTLFAKSFTPDDLQALRQDFGRLAGTPRMPTRPPQAPQPELLPGSAPDVSARLRQPPEPPGVPAEVPRPRVEALPGGAGPGRRMPDAPPEPAPVTPRQALGERPAFAGPRAGTWGAILATMTAMGVPASITATTAALGAAHVTQRQARWLLSNALLDPKRRGLMQAALDSQGRLDRRVYGVMEAILRPAEQRAYQRETRGTR
jgi:hypothetical protein